jgi:hypothetical protein
MLILYNNAYSQYSIDNFVISNGYYKASNSSYTLEGTVGQQAIGEYKEADKVIYQTGFWYGVETNPNSILKIPLSMGWNMISSYIKPQLDSVQIVFSEIQNNLIISKNNSGSVYIPSYYLNNIGKWNITQGYQIYMSVADTLQISGTVVNPVNTQITLSQGWNMIAYLRNSELDCETAFEGIINKLVIVKDNEGNVYIPEYGINTIVNLKPGQGYQIYMTNSDVLIYPDKIDTIASVKIGNQVWMLKNLDVSTYRNGDAIRYASSNSDWVDA